MEIPNTVNMEATNTANAETPTAANAETPTAANAETPTTAIDRRNSSWLRDLRIGTLSIGAASTVLVALRLLSVAQFNPETAYGILQANGTTSVVIGTVISLIPSIAIIAALCLISWLIYSEHDELSEGLVFALWTTMGVLVLIALITTPVRYILFLAGCTLLVLIVWAIKTWIKEIQKKTAGQIGSRVLALFVAAILVFGVVISPPWMPPEHLSFSHAPPVTGYILTQSSDGVTVLQISPRKLMYYGPGALTGQTPCSNVPAFDFPAVYYTRWFHPGHYVNC